MRKSKADKAATHERIVSLAGKRFRELGIEGIGVAELMKQAGTSAGGFYKHFRSREDLVIEALGESFADLDRIEQEAENLPALFTRYLSEQHCAHPESGCAITALAGDVRHASTGVRGVFTERTKRTLAHYADRLEGEGPSRRARALLMLSAAMGAVSLARAVNDKKLSREILTAVREQLVAMSR